MNKDQIALQLYTVRDKTAGDFAGTVRQVAAAGYAAVEFAGYGGLSAGEVASLLTETGLRAASTHVGLTALESDLQGQIDYCKAISCSYLVLPGLPSEQHNAAALRALAPRLNEFGRACRDQGITFAYHNHNWEFETDGAGGAFLLDGLLDATDPALVALELDVYWAAFADQDPLAYLRRRAGRVPLVHVKDMAPAPDRGFAEVGDGTLDMRAIIATAEDAGARWFVVENDAPRMDSLESAHRSLHNLQSMATA